MRPNTDAEYAILGLLSQGSRHGYDIARRFQAGTPLGQVWQLRRNEVYAILAKLEGQGWISREGVAGGPRRRMTYRLTPQGADAFQAWLQRPVQGLRDLRLGLLGRLYFAAALGPAQWEVVVRRQEEALRQRLEAWQRARDRAPDPFSRSVYDFRAVMLQAALQWLGEISTRGLRCAEA
jgi:DNA-binding PadR family transcriptional regulator